MTTPSAHSESWSRIYNLDLIHLLPRVQVSRILPLASDQATRSYIPDSDKQDQHYTGHRTPCRHSPHRPACGPRSPPRPHRPLPLVSSSPVTTTPRIRSSDPTRGFSKMTEVDRLRSQAVALEARGRNQSDRGTKSWWTIRNGHYGSVSKGLILLRHLDHLLSHTLILCRIRDSSSANHTAPPVRPGSTEGDVPPNGLQ